MSPSRKPSPNPPEAPFFTPRVVMSTKFPSQNSIETQEEIEQYEYQSLLFEAQRAVEEILGHDGPDPFWQNQNFVMRNLQRKIGAARQAGHDVEFLKEALRDNLPYVVYRRISRMVDVIQHPSLSKYYIQGCELPLIWARRLGFDTSDIDGPIRQLILNNK